MSKNSRFLNGRSKDTWTLSLDRIFQCMTSKEMIRWAIWPRIASSRHEHSDAQNPIIYYQVNDLGHFIQPDAPIRPSRWCYRCGNLDDLHNSELLWNTDTDSKLRMMAINNIEDRIRMCDSRNSWKQKTEFMAPWASISSYGINRLLFARRIGWSKRALLWALIPTLIYAKYKAWCKKFTNRKWSQNRH